MLCPACRAEIPVSAHRCPSCQVALSPAVQIGVLTPPPLDAPTRIASPPSVVDTTGLPAPQAGYLTDDAPTADTLDLPTVVNASATGAEEAQATARSPRLPPAVRASRPAASPPIDSGDTGPLQPGKPFGPRYHVIRQLGLGGMGAVYQAWDTELSVAVAIKVIRPETMADPAAAREIERRFKRELLLARQVTHKNVVRIHDLGEIDGIKYITMSYIDGIDLASLLKRDGRLPVPQALGILRSVIPGLVAAHQAGVVHRDLKPANIMIGKRGDALIMDFGIALSTDAGDEDQDEPAALPEELRRAAAGQTEATLAGSLLGTIHYMAPEQARSEKVDQRADIYAIGLILYDMLLGRRRAENAASAMGELKERMAHAPPSVKSVAPEIPSAVDAIVSRCLDPDPTRRFQATVELVAALDRLDENGEPLPVRRVVGLPLMAAIVVLLVGLGAGAWYYQRQFIPPPAHDPVSVVIADFQNLTGDPTFDRALEPTLKRALEDATFISAYDRAGIGGTLGVRPPETLDAAAARELALKQGLNVVLSGAVERQGSGYGISARATQTVTGDVIADVKGKASNRDQLVGAAATLAASIRDALGDDNSDTARQFANVTLSTTSLEVVRHHAAAMHAMSNNRFEEALGSFQKAVALDPKFGIGYQGMASIAFNLGRRQDAEKYIGEALRYVDGMTERERYNTRGLYYFLTGDHKACVREYGDLVARYPASPNARNNLALCLTYLRDIPRAMEEVRHAVEILPNRPGYRTNLALYASYATDFTAADKEARAIQAPDAYAHLALAFAQLGQGQTQQAQDTYRLLGTKGAVGASLAASGLGDLAVYEGRFSEAVRIFEQGAAADVTSKLPDRAAAKLASLAHAQALRGQSRFAVAAAKRALNASQDLKIRFLVARTLVEAGEITEARTLAASLAREVQAEPQAYAKVIEGEVALKTNDPRVAVQLFTEANGLLDTWIGHYGLGQAYLDTSQFAQADSEFDR